MRFLTAASLIALAAVIASAPLAAQPKPAAAPAKAATPAAAKPPKVEGGLIVKPSELSVKDTLDKLAKAVEEKGAKVVARVDHAAGAKAVGAAMKPSEVLIFGNPKLGTPLMQGNVRAGFDLPMKVLAYEDDAGKVWVVYNNAKSLKARYKLKGKDADAAVDAMGAALDGLTGAATKK